MGLRWKLEVKPPHINSDGTSTYGTFCFRCQKPEEALPISPANKCGQNLALQSTPSPLDFLESAANSAQHMLLGFFMLYIGLGIILSY